MITSRRDGSAERKIAIAMVVNKTVLAAISSRWSTDLFSSRWANIVGELCVNYYRKYKQAPLKDIEGLVDSWAGTGRDKDLISLVDQFLRELSSEYAKSDDEINPQYILDLASEYFDKVALKNTAKEINGCLEIGDIDAARKAHIAYKAMQIGQGAGINVFNEESAVVSAFTEKREPLIKYPGALGNFFGTALERDAFISFMGKEKVGKSFWLMDIAWRAIEQQRKVCLFAIGDMSQAQMIRRIAVRAARWPVKAGTIKVPREFDTSGTKPEIVREDVEFGHDLTDSQVTRVFEKLRNEYGEHSFKLSVHPNSSISVDGIRSIVDLMEKNDDWISDVNVIDYADIIAPIKGLIDTRAQIDYAWKHLRALPQERHNLLVTATQSNKLSYRTQTIDRNNVSEDKRKLAHVTGMIGINQDPEEQTLGLYRLNWVVLRELEFSEEQCCYTAASLALGQPAMLSTF